MKVVLVKIDNQHEIDKLQNIVKVFEIVVFQVVTPALSLPPPGALLPGALLGAAGGPPAADESPVAASDEQRARRAAPPAAAVGGGGPGGSGGPGRCTSGIGGGGGPGGCAGGPGGGGGGPSDGCGDDGPIGGGRPNVEQSSIAQSRSSAGERLTYGRRGVGAHACGARGVRTAAAATGMLLMLRYGGEAGLRRRACGGGVRACSGRGVRRRRGSVRAAATAARWLRGGRGGAGPGCGEPGAQLPKVPLAARADHVLRGRARGRRLVDRAVGDVRAQVAQVGRAAVGGGAGGSVVGVTIAGVLLSGNPRDPILGEPDYSRRSNFYPPISSGLATYRWTTYGSAYRRLVAAARA